MCGSVLQAPSNKGLSKLRRRALGEFAMASAAILLSALAVIFVGKGSIQLVSTAAAVAVAVSVFFFVSRFNSSKKRQIDSTVGAPPAEFPQDSNLGVKVLRFAIIGVLFAFAFNIVVFSVEAWQGTLDADDLRRIIPKAALAFVLIGYVLRKIKTRTPF